MTTQAEKGLLVWCQQDFLALVLGSDVLQLWLAVELCLT